MATVSYSLSSIVQSFSYLQVVVTWPYSCCCHQVNSVAKAMGNDKTQYSPWRTLEGSRWKEIGGRSSLASWKILWTRRTVATLATWRATWYRARGRSTRRAASWYVSTSWCYFGNKHVFNGSSFLLIYYEVKHELYFKKKQTKQNKSEKHKCKSSKYRTFTLLLSAFFTLKRFSIDHEQEMFLHSLVGLI